MTDDRSAIVQRKEQIQALARPGNIGTADIIGEVAAVRETEDTFRVYRSEWLIVVTTADNGEEGLEEARRIVFDKYSGRVREEDVSFENASKSQPDAFPVLVKLRLPNVKGEFKTRALAETYVDKMGWTDATIVPRNSRVEQALKEYGRTKLPSAS